MKFREPVQFEEILNAIKNNQDNGMSYCIYSKIPDSNHLRLDTICYLDDYPEITDDDEEIFSDFVINNSLELLLRDELVQDVIHNALHQKVTITDQEILKAIRYYNDNDDFMDF